MEIYLSYSEPNLETAVRLKEDIESYTSLSVSLESEDWEEVEDCEFEAQIHQADVLLNLTAETSNITAWLIDEEKRLYRTKEPPMEVSLPQTVDISYSSYEDGFAVLLGLISRHMDRRFGPLQMQHESEEEYESSVELESTRESMRCLASTAKVDSVRPLGSDSQRNAKHEMCPREIFSKSKMESERTLDRDEALKARRKQRSSRKNRLREARSHRTVPAY
ncbi:unnamed protein product [Cylindrotheca closterium]|uniref:Uncharacterized protein n=1 Tax=Cylindrotheca closterium TaxID=2856 RepID=A0AAD2PTY6_9STRA|nr:unnamed protein product [Cylindrotheca closterium]